MKKLAPLALACATSGRSIRARSRARLVEGPAMRNSAAARPALATAAAKSGDGLCTISLAIRESKAGLVR